MDDWIKGALVTLPVCHSNSGLYPTLIDLWRHFYSVVLWDVQQPLMLLLEQSMLGDLWLLFYLFFCAYQIIKHSICFMAVHK